MNCTMCNFNTSNSPVSVCCELNYPENCEKEIEKVVDLSKENKESKEYKARKIDRETGEKELDEVFKKRREIESGVNNEIQY